MLENILHKLAYFIYKYDIKDLKSEDTFYSVANKITCKQYMKISKDILDLYNNTTYRDKNLSISPISQYFSKLDSISHKTESVINDAHVKQAYAVVNFIEKESKVFNKAVVYFDNSGSIDISKYTSILKNITEKYNNIEIYTFDTLVSEPYESDIDFIENVQQGFGGTDGLELIKDIFNKLTYKEKIEFFIISDFYMETNEDYFKTYVNHIVETYKSTVTTIDINSI